MRKRSAAAYLVADAFAAALAKQQNSDLVTGASEHKALEKEIKID